MKLVEKVPKDLYKIFGSKYMEFYMQFLVALYEESSQSYSLLGLTERECQMIMNERLAKMALDWSEARVDEEGELITRANMASVSLKHVPAHADARVAHDRDKADLAALGKLFLIDLELHIAVFRRILDGV